MSLALYDGLKLFDLSEHFNLFLENGFDEWDTLMLITDDDMASLHLPLQHRQVLRSVINASQLAARNRVKSTKQNKASHQIQEPCSRQHVPDQIFRRRFRIPRLSKVQSSLATVRITSLHGQELCGLDIIVDNVDFQELPQTKPGRNTRLLNDQPLSESAHDHQYSSIYLTRVNSRPTCKKKKEIQKPTIDSSIRSRIAVSSCVYEIQQASYCIYANEMIMFLRQDRILRTGIETLEQQQSYVASVLNGVTNGPEFKAYHDVIRHLEAYQYNDDAPLYLLCPWAGTPRPYVEIPERQGSGTILKLELSLQSCVSLIKLIRVMRTHSS